MEALLASCSLSRLFIIVVAAAALVSLMAFLAMSPSSAVFFGFLIPSFKTVNRVHAPADELQGSLTT